MLHTLGSKEKGFPGENAMNNNGVAERSRRWEGLHPEILALIFSKIPPVEMVKCLPLVCKSWMEVVSGPYCWRDIDIQAWSRRRNDSRAVDPVVKKLISRGNCRVQRLSAYHVGEVGFFFVANCGRWLEVLEIPMSNITDHMVRMHIKAMPNLKVLDISFCSKITAKGLALFGNHCKSLVNLKRNIPPPKERRLSIQESEAKAIGDTMPNLHRLELCFGRCSDSGLSEILTKCKSLTHLDIRGCWNVKLNGDLREICEKLECFKILHSYIPQMDRLRLWWRYWSRSMKDKDVFMELEACKDRVLRITSLGDIYI